MVDGLPNFRLPWRFSRRIDFFNSCIFKLAFLSKAQSVDFRHYYRADIELYNTSGILRADRDSRFGKRISSREPLTGIRKAKNTLLDTVGQNWRKDDATVKHISDKFYGLIFNCNRLLDYSFIIRIGTKIGNYE